MIKNGLLPLDKINISIGVKDGSLNQPYTYANDNPVRYYDPFGLSPSGSPFPTRPYQLPPGGAFPPSGGGENGGNSGGASSACPSPSNRCIQAEEECHNECEHLLGVDRYDQGIPYRVCRELCMKAKGC